MSSIFFCDPLEDKIIYRVLQQRLSSLMQQTFRNQTASIILIYVQRFGRYEFSKGPLQFEILVKISATDQKRWQINKTDLYKFDS
jgi:hypothetical protein